MPSRIITGAPASDNQSEPLVSLRLSTSLEQDYRNLGVFPGLRAETGKRWGAYLLFFVNLDFAHEVLAHAQDRMKEIGSPMATNTVNQVPLTGWRAKADTLAQEAREIIEAVREAGEAGSVSDQLLEFAGRHAEATANAVKLPNTTRSQLLWDVYGLAALLKGAAAVPDATKAAKRLVDAALKLCNGASEYLDRLDGAEAQEGGDSAQPPSAGGIASPAPVSQAVGAFGNESAGALWQMAMDEACNTDPRDGEEGITRVIALLGALKPYLMGASDRNSATVQGGAEPAAGTDERVALASQAVCEAYSLVDLVDKAIQAEEEIGGGKRDALRSMLRRVQTMLCCVLSAVDDDVATLDDIRQQMSAA